MNTQKMTDSEANVLLEKWQKRLLLTDWVIAIHANAKPGDFIGQNRAGETEWQEVNKAAVIRILNPEDYGERIIPYHFERTLVHELLHLKFCLLGESGNSLQDRYVHQLIDDLARALTDKNQLLANDSSQQHSTKNE
jgi:hypothetical protein